MNFAEMIKEARKRTSLSQGKLAQQMRTSRRPEGVWPTYIGQIEKGEKVPSDEICIKLAEVLELDSTEVLLAALEARSDSEQTRDLCQKMRRALTDPVVNHLLSAEEPFDPALLEALGDPQWRRFFTNAYLARGKRDIPALLERFEAMNSKQWDGLMSILEGMGL